jgi:hypothetical protein
MAIVLPIEPFSIPASTGKSYYEDLTGSSSASVTVYNAGAFPISLVLTRSVGPLITYVIPALSSLTVKVDLLLVAALLTSAAGGTSGTIRVSLF